MAMQVVLAGQQKLGGKVASGKVQTEKVESGHCSLSRGESARAREVAEMRGRWSMVRIRTRTVDGGIVGLCSLIAVVGRGIVAFSTDWDDENARARKWEDLLSYRDELRRRTDKEIEEGCDDGRR
jgi:hypothetical protein